MNIRARAIAALLTGLGIVGPVLADPDADGWGPRQPAGSKAGRGIKRAGHEIVAPPTVLPPATVDLPDMPKVPDAPDKLPTPAEVSDRPPGPAVPPIPPAAAIPPAPPAACPTPAPAMAMFDSVPGGLWAEVGYLQWRYRGAPIPPLVTAGAAVAPGFGALNTTGSRVLYGGGSAPAEWANGVRARVGGPVNGSPYGWEVGAFYTQPQAAGAAFGSRDFQVLARPFYDTLRNHPSSFVFGLAGEVDGVVTVRSRTEFWGFDAHGTLAVSDASTVFAGYRHLVLDDELRVLTQDRVGEIGSFITGTFLPAGSFEAQGDRFTTHNRFDGAELGWRYRHGFGKVGLDVRASVALGVTSERITVEGGTQTVDPLGVSRGAPAGFLALPSNSGQFDRDRFTVLPQAGARVTYQVKPGVQLFAGYDVLYWPRVARAGDQVDIAQDTRQNPSSFDFTGVRGVRPAVLLRDTTFWAHGLTFGVQVEY